MKVLQLGKVYPIRGGVEKVMWDLTRGLADRGVGCDMLCCMRPGSSVDLKDAQFHQMDGSRNIFSFQSNSYIYCMHAWNKMAGSYLAPSMCTWLAAHKKEYDIVHIHYPDPMAALALKYSGYRGKVVLHWHSDPEGSFASYMASWLIRRAQVIVGTTPDYIKASPFLQKVQDKCRVVPIGIDPVDYSPAEVQAIKSRYTDRTLLLTVGRLVPYKGFNYLIDAVKMLPDSYHLVISGAGPMRKQLQKQIEENGLRKKVTLAGFLSYEELPNWFHAADVFVLSSIFKSEAFGIVQIEAMSCGTPVVATTIPGSGVSWVNQEGVSGVNVPPCNPEALAKAIQLVAKDRERYGTGAKRLFAERYTFGSMIDSIIGLYKELLQ